MIRERSQLVDCISSKSDSSNVVISLAQPLHGAPNSKMSSNINGSLGSAFAWGPKSDYYEPYVSTVLGVSKHNE